MIFKKYEEQDFLRIRDFITHSIQKLGKPNCWMIDRWEFLFYYGELRNKNLPNWLNEIGIWEDSEGRIFAVACTDDEAFFLLDTFEPSIELIEILINYAEEHLSHEKDGKKVVSLSIPDYLIEMATTAASMGYVLRDGYESIISIPIDNTFKVELPAGFILQCGLEVSDEQKALGHIMAFDYAAKLEDASLTKMHYGNLKNAPDYRPDLDLYITTQQGDVAAFCTLWYDPVNQIATFEPVGTHKNYRFKGLGKAVMYEGLNRLRALDVSKAYVGATQPFYEKIGFTTEVKIYKWYKHL